MSLTKRTPPVSPVKPSKPSRSTSTTSTMSMSDSEERTKLMKSRGKRKYDDDFTTFMSEMKQMFENWQSKQDQKFHDLQKIVDEFKENNNQFRISFEFIASQCEDLKSRLDGLQKDSAENRACIRSLETKIEQLEQRSKILCIEVRNVPSLGNKSESKEFLSEVILKVGKVLDMDLRTSDIRDVYRTSARPGLCRPIIAEFNSVITKEKFIDATKSFNKRHPSDRMNTALLQLECPKTPIYISEVLTSRIKKLHFLSREHAKTHKYAFCWVAHGKLYLRKKENSPAIRINSEKDLDKLDAKTPTDK